MYQDHDDSNDCPDVFLGDEHDEDGFEVWPDERWVPIAYPEDDAETVDLSIEPGPPMRPAA